MVCTVSLPFADCCYEIRMFWFWILAYQAALCSLYSPHSADEPQLFSSPNVGNKMRKKCIKILANAEPNCTLNGSNMRKHCKIAVKQRQQERWTDESIAVGRKKRWINMLSAYLVSDTLMLLMGIWADYSTHEEVEMERVCVCVERTYAHG